MTETVSLSLRKHSISLSSSSSKVTYSINVCKLYFRFHHFLLHVHLSFCRSGLLRRFRNELVTALRANAFFCSVFGFGFLFLGNLNGYFRFVFIFLSIFRAGGKFLVYGGKKFRRKSELLEDFYGFRAELLLHVHVYGVNVTYAIIGKVAIRQVVKLLSLTLPGVSQVYLRIHSETHVELLRSCHVFLSRFFSSSHKRHYFVDFRIVHLVLRYRDVLVSYEFHRTLSRSAYQVFGPFGRVQYSGRSEYVEYVYHAFDFGFLADSKERLRRKAYSERSLQVLIGYLLWNLLSVLHYVRPLFGSPVLLHEPEPSLSNVSKRV